MAPKFAAVGLLAIALLPAQQLTEVERRFFDSADDALGVHPGAVMADIGTGHTFMHPLRIAGKVGPQGRVVCVDVKPTVIADVREQAQSQHLTNIEAVLGKEDDPLLAPETFDGILISNTYHEFTEPSAMLQHLREALKADGRLVVLELYSKAHESESRAEQVKRHDLSPDILERELSAAGFVVKERIDDVPLNAGRFRYLFRAEKSK
ncbi:MAG TPA: methyltransferase domain-containing protein [Bryobacterales bacterium]|nr:methyltransferase domain-containing protein [Bryobacterales bacterium]